MSAFLSYAVPQYHIRALTSNASSPAAADLAAKPNVSVVQANLNSVKDLLEAFANSTLIFANTQFEPGTFMARGPSGAETLEGQQGLNIAHAASQIPTLQHFNWSTLPDGVSISDGKYYIPHFQSKTVAEKYIRSSKSGLAGKTTFIRVGMYGSNLPMDSYRPRYIVSVPVPCSSPGNADKDSGSSPKVHIHASMFTRRPLSVQRR